MAKRQPDPFQSIDLQKLDTVQGGMAAARSSAAVKSAQAADPMMTMLTSIEQSLAAISSQPSPMQMMLQMFEMMHGINPGAPATAARQQNAPLMASTQGAWKSKK